MSRMKLYRFDLYCGRMGSLEGTFIADERLVKVCMGRRAYFGEVLGKHSEVECDLSPTHLRVLTDDQEFIARAEQYGLVPSGFDPIATIQASAADERRSARWRREHADDD